MRKVTLKQVNRVYKQVKDLIKDSNENWIKKDIKNILENCSNILEPENEECYLVAKLVFIMLAQEMRPLDKGMKTEFNKFITHKL